MSPACPRLCSPSVVACPSPAPPGRLEPDSGSALSVLFSFPACGAVGRVSPNYGMADSPSVLLPARRRVRADSDSDSDDDERPSEPMPRTNFRPRLVLGFVLPQPRRNDRPNLGRASASASPCRVLCLPARCRVRAFLLRFRTERPSAGFLSSAGFSVGFCLGFPCVRCTNRRGNVLPLRPPAFVRITPRTSVGVSRADSVSRNHDGTYARPPSTACGFGFRLPNL